MFEMSSRGGDGHFDDALALRALHRRASGPLFDLESLVLALGTDQFYHLPDSFFGLASLVFVDVPGKVLPPAGTAAGLSPPLAGVGVSFLAASLYESLR